MMTSCTALGDTPARSSAPLMAAAPSCGAVRPCSVPLRTPMGVRAEPTMYTSCAIVREEAPLRFASNEYCAPRRGSFSFSGQVGPVGACLSLSAHAASRPSVGSLRHRRACRAALTGKVLAAVVAITFTLSFLCSRLSLLPSPVLLRRQRCALLPPPSRYVSCCVLLAAARCRACYQMPKRRFQSLLNQRHKNTNKKCRRKTRRHDEKNLSAPRPPFTRRGSAGPRSRARAPRRRPAPSCTSCRTGRGRGASSRCGPAPQTKTRGRWRRQEEVCQACATPRADPKKIMLGVRHRPLALHNPSLPPLTVRRIPWSERLSPLRFA